LTLLLGSPRSGTTWLAKILDTYDAVLYLHEPFRKIRVLAAASGRRAENDTLLSSRRDAVLDEIVALQADCARPPFFRKRFRKYPTALVRAACAARGRAGRADPWAAALFRRLYEVPRGGACELLVKEVDWHPGLPAVRHLDPDHVIVIVRHPCAVVYSRLAGIQQGFMPAHNRDAWFAHNRERAEGAGYSADAVAKLSPRAFYALDWLVENLEYEALTAGNERFRTVVYEELCRDPLRVSQHLFRLLGWQMRDATARFIRGSTVPTWREALLRRLFQRRSYFGIRRDPQVAANSWRTLMSAEEIDEVLDVVRGFRVMDNWRCAQDPTQ
jgi:hypothetical protein